MNNYIFRTSATMKEYNCRKWWIDSDIVTEKRIQAENIAAALEIYRQRVEEENYISVSRNAIKSRANMYIDNKNGNAKQVGYVITGKTEFNKGDYSGYSMQYIDSWVTVLTVVDTEFPEVEQ